MTNLDFETVVDAYHKPLYQFAFSLTRSESDACDLTQETFYIWATKGHQLRDPSKAKSWLFTTLHRVFLETGRRKTRFPHFELAETDAELPVIVLEPAHRLDALQAVAALGEVDEVYRAPVALFYLEDYSYQEIADILQVPMGTVKSRISRGLAQLKEIFSDSNLVRYQPGDKLEQPNNRANAWAVLTRDD